MSLKSLLLLCLLVSHVCSYPTNNNKDVANHAPVVKGALDEAQETPQKVDQDGKVDEAIKDEAKTEEDLVKDPADNDQAKVDAPVVAAEGQEKAQDGAKVDEQAQEDGAKVDENLKEDQTKAETPVAADEEEKADDLKKAADENKAGKKADDDAARRGRTDEDKVDDKEVAKTEDTAVQADQPAAAVETPAAKEGTKPAADEEVAETQQREVIAQADDNVDENQKAETPQVAAAEETPVTDVKADTEAVIPAAEEKKA